MITFNDIYETERKEKYSKQLQKLPKKFLSEVNKYLTEKKELSKKKKDSKIQKQLETAKILFKELMLNRRRKILSLVLIASETGVSKQDFDSMFDFERELFENLIECIKNSEKNFKEIFNGKNQMSKKNELVVFKENVEEFVDLTGGKLGPYKKSEIANLPKEIVKILVDDNKCDVVEK
jgi:DNA replication initiation complex subunit (GINS family)